MAVVVSPPLRPSEPAPLYCPGARPPHGEGGQGDNRGEEAERRWPTFASLDSGEKNHDNLNPNPNPNHNRNHKINNKNNHDQGHIHNHNNENKENK